jgi:flavin reductase (DIM6/NTAB) family NADH-FMN oxidoreductase RutF
MECRLLQTVNFPHHDIFIGEIVETYCDESCLKGDKVDMALLRPILFTMDDRGYWSVGERIATAWDVGKDFQ